MNEQELLAENLTVIQGTKQSTEITNIDRLKVALVGEPKSRKSSLIARTGRKPLLVYDFDDRREAIAGIEGVTIKTLIDIDDSTPTAWGALESDIGTLEYLRQQGKLVFKSVALDSVTFLRKYAEHQFLKDASSASRAKYRIGSTTYLIPKDWDAVTGVQRMLEGVLSRLFALEIDVFMTFHTRPEKDQVRSTSTNAVYKDTLVVEPPNLKMLLPKFNEQWRMIFDGNNFKVQTQPDNFFNASTAMKNLEQYEEPDILKMIKKHNNGIK